MGKIEPQTFWHGDVKRGLLDSIHRSMVAKSASDCGRPRLTLINTVCKYCKTSIGQLVDMHDFATPTEPEGQSTKQSTRKAVPTIGGYRLIHLFNCLLVEV